MDEQTSTDQPAPAWQEPTLTAQHRAAQHQDRAMQLMPQAAEGVTRRVDQLTPESQSLPTPCTQWSVRDVANHLTYEHRWVPHLLRGERVEDVGDRYDGDLLGDDPAAAWRSALEESLAAWADTPAEQTVHLSYADVPASAYAEEMLADLTVHAWDLARGARLDDRLDPECVEHVLGWAREHADELSGSGVFAPSVDISSDDPQDQLLALLGRRP